MRFLRSALVLIVLFFVVIVAVACGRRSGLPVLNQEAKVTYRGTCDEGKTKVTRYHRDGAYELAVVDIKEDDFLYLMYEVGWRGSDSEYWVKTPDTPYTVKVTHGVYDRIMK